MFTFSPRMTARDVVADFIAGETIQVRPIWLRLKIESRRLAQTSWFNLKIGLLSSVQRPHTPRQPNRIFQSFGKVV